MMNARIYFRTLIAILLLGAASSCSHEDSIYGEDSKKNVSLTLSLGEQAVNVSRAAVAGDGTENVVKTIELFIYKEDGIPVYFQNDEITKNDNGEITFTMLVQDFDLLGDEPQVYAIVNRGDNTLPSDYSIDALKQMVLTAAFVKNGAVQAQESFVMDGLTTVTRTDEALTGNIPLERVAVKIGLKLVDADGKDAESLTVKNEQGVAVWTASKDDVQISLRRGSNATYLGSTPDEYVYQAQPNDMFSTDFASLASNSTFYSYPVNWETNENARTHLMLKVNWTKADNSERKETFYEINVNPAGSYTERNHYYQIEQEISVLGSEEEDEPLPLIPASYKVIPWQTTNASTGTLSRPRYLMVEETAITLQNVETKRIYFNSSDPIYLKSVKVDWNDTSGDLAEFKQQANKTYSSNSNTDQTYEIEGGRLKDGYKATITVHNADVNDANDRSYIEIQHKLDNSMKSTSDYTQYQFELNVAHHDNDSYNETIKITQYPMISIVADQNYDWEHGTGNNTNGNKGYVIINNGGVGGLTGLFTTWDDSNGMRYSNNPNRYIVSVSSLDKDEDEYIIGDPRASNPTDYSNTNDIATDDNRKELSNYYPTVEDNSTLNMISPQFMIASSYGACTSENLSAENARKRCATYQEDGYPAGRWRVPTKAEIKFMVKLSSWGIIPALFADYKYLSAHGSIRLSDDEQGVVDVTGNNGAVRCVYDTWRWGTDHTAGSTAFIYGDEAQR